MSEANYTKPASQEDLEARQADDYVPSTVLNRGADGEPSDNGYVGVDPIYQNHANETEAPMKADEESVEQKLLNENFLADEVDYDKTATPDGQGESDEDDEEEQKAPSGPATPTPTPPSGGNPS